MTIRLFLLDDHEIVRRGLRELIESEPDMLVVGDSGSALEATRRIPALRPDLMVLDARLPDGSGITVCRDVRSRDPSIAALVLTAFDDAAALTAAVAAGAAGYVLKEIRGMELIAAIRRVATGESLLDEQAVEQLRQSWGGDGPVDQRLASLSAQERRVLTRIGEGMTNRQIGASLSLAEKTVKNYVTSVLTKLEMERRTQAAVFAAERGIQRPRPH